MRNLFFRNYIMVAVLLVVSICTTFAQGTVSGVVKDDSGSPIIGAIVMVPNSTTATATDYEGKFTLSNVTGDTLEASFMGMTTESVNIAGRSYVEFTLTSDSTEIDDVVVIGYGAVKRADLTGSVSSVSADDMQAPGATSVTTMLKGKAAGVSISTESATPGGYNAISIRGQGTPLIVVDGIPQSSFVNTTSTNYSGEDTDDTMIALNPDDIESIDILKDAASTAIYGANAAGGVILITTKSGKGLTKPQISYSGNVSFSTISDYPTVLNAQEFMTEGNKALAELGQDARYSQDLIDSYVGNGTDWVGELSRDVAVSHEHTFAIRNSTENTRYTISGSYKDLQGVVLMTDMNRITARASIDQDINKWLTFGANISVATINYQQVPYNMGSVGGASKNIGSALTFNPLVGAYDQTGTGTTNPDAIFSSPYAGLINVLLEKKQRSLSTYGHLTLKPVKNLTVTGTFGYDQKTTDDNYFSGLTASASNSGMAYKLDDESGVLLANVVANYTNTFKEKHNFSAMVGWEFKEETYEYDYKYAESFARPEAGWSDMATGTNTVIATSDTTSQLASYFGRVNYSFDSRYIITANLRVDGSSNFAANHQYGFFPGVSGAWRISQEEFLKYNHVLSDLKLRASWGQVGNAGSLTGTNSTYTINSNAEVFDSVLVNSASISAYGNPDLKWETSTDITFGIDYGFLNNRISGVIDVYQRITSDYITSKSLMSYNELTTIKTNSDERIRTRGIDITVSSNNIVKPNFTWSTDLTFSYYRMRTIDRDADWTPEVYETYEQNCDQIWRYKTDGLLAEGESLSYINNSSGGCLNILDLNGYARDDSGVIVYGEDGSTSYCGEADGQLDEADKYMAGYTTPIPFGINNNFTYKNWDLNIYIYGSLGGMMDNYVKEYCATYPYGITTGFNMPMEYVSERWSPDNPTGTMPGVNSYGISTVSTTDFCLEKAWYARLDNITLGYTFSKSQIKSVLSSLRLYVSARNLCVITPYDGMDPETGGAYGSYPNARTFLVGANLNF